MRILSCFLVYRHLVEPVHVELSDEGRHVGVFVVVGQQRLGELCLVPDDERIAFATPADQRVWNNKNCFAVL